MKILVCCTLRPCCVPIDILIEATFSQKVWAARVSIGDQGGVPTLGQWPQCYRVWYEIDLIQIGDKNLIMLKTINEIDYNTIIIISKWISSVLYFLWNYQVCCEQIESQIFGKLSPSICIQLTTDKYLRCCL